MNVKRQSFFVSSIGRKIIVAVTGTLLILFVIVHMLGNLQMFSDPEAINKYAVLLKSMPAVLWGARAGLLAIFCTHLGFALWLNAENMRARPEAYRANNTVQASFSSRTMVLSGVVVLLYVIGHLFHFTIGLIQPEALQLHDLAGRHDVYSMVVIAFQQPVISLLYIVSMLCLWPHLSHGIGSMFQTISLRGPRSRMVIDSLGPLLSTVIVLGYISIPLAVISGLIGLPPWRA